MHFLLPLQDPEEAGDYSAGKITGGPPGFNTQALNRPGLWQVFPLEDCSAHPLFQGLELDNATAQGFKRGQELLQALFALLNLTGLYEPLGYGPAVLFPGLVEDPGGLGLTLEPCDRLFCPE
jgi:hypothetical protein